jgi:glycerol-3-phosphate acyltransferase PlsY
MPKYIGGIENVQWVLGVILIIVSYIIGSIPFGLILVKLKTGKDIRHVESGRTGGTNAMRAAGFWIGVTTALMDLFKGVAAVWLVRSVTGGNAWLEVLAPLATILGHNHSIFLPERRENGKLHLRGGAGGAPCAGGALGLWPPSILIILPIAGLILYFVGYASIATLSAAFVSILIFTVTWWVGITPWQYILYGVFAAVLLALALRPNIQRLIQGNERVIGYRAKKKEKAQSSSSSNSSSSSS